MSNTTKRGDALAMLLNPYLGTTEAIRETCALIARHAVTHAAYMTLDCNNGLTTRQQARVDQIEDRITELVALLPHTDDGPITVRFSGDPRGFTVKLHVPNQPQQGNTWGLGGDFGV